MDPEIAFANDAAEREQSRHELGMSDGSRKEQKSRQESVHRGDRLDDYTSLPSTCR